MKKLKVGDIVTTYLKDKGIVYQVLKIGYNIKFNNGIYFYTDNLKFGRLNYSNISEHDIILKKSKRKLPDWF